MPDSYPNVTLDDAGIYTLCRVHERSPRLKRAPLGKKKLLEILTSRQRFAWQADPSSARPGRRIRQKVSDTGMYLIAETLKSSLSPARKMRTIFHLLLYLYYMVRNNLDVAVPEGWRKYLPLAQVSFEGKGV
jgi:hypothetical protein